MAKKCERDTDKFIEIIKLESIKIDKVGIASNHKLSVTIKNPKTNQK